MTFVTFHNEIITIQKFFPNLVGTHFTRFILKRTSMKKSLSQFLAIGIISMVTMANIQAQVIGEASMTTDTIYIAKMEVKAAKKFVFNAKRTNVSNLVVMIDTLIMCDHSALKFYDKSTLELLVNHAEIGNGVQILGRGLKNNGANMDISMKFVKLGSLTVFANGRPSLNELVIEDGRGGNVTLRYDHRGITPQQQDRFAENYIDIQTNGGRYDANGKINEYYLVKELSKKVADKPFGLKELLDKMSGVGRPGKAEIVEI